MKLLLKEDVDGLGFVGDEVEVRDGYGRNFLVPQGKALLATPKNLKRFNHQKSIVQGKLKKVRGAAEAVAQEISKVTCAFTKKVGDQGKLFGSVTTQEIAEALRLKGIDIDRRKIQLAEPIKQLGDFKVPVKLHADVTAEIQLTVAGEKVEEAAAPKDEPTEEQASQSS